VEGKINEVGLIITANSGPNLNNSEFFITLTKANINSLVGKHTVFGKIEEGFDVLKKISDTYVDASYRPQMNIRILHTFLLDDPFPDV
jgi:peptidyl-prolyl cis-trans isomerase-like 4